MTARGLCCVVLALASLCQVTAQSRTQEIANLTKQIARLKAIEAEQAKLYQMLDSGTVVMLRVGDTPPFAVRASDIRQEFLTAMVVAEASKPDPDFMSAERRANEAATRVLASCKEDSRAKKQSLPTEMSAVRTSRQKAERELKLLQNPKSPQARRHFGGTWKSNWGKMILNQAGTRVTGTYEHQNGKITGDIGADGSLRFSWTQNNGHGIGVFKLGADGRTLSGTWNYTDENGAVGSGGTWSATRQ